MRAPLGSRGALLGDLGISLGAALGGRVRRSRIDMRGRGRWPSAGATLDLDFVNQQGYAYGQGIGRIRDLATISGGAGGTVVGPSGLIVSASAPRFDYDPVSLACKGLLIEEQRTQKIWPTDDFTHANWSVSRLTPVPAALTRLGVPFTKLVEDATTGRHQITIGGAYTAGAYTVTILAVAGERRYITFGRTSGGANTYTVTVDLLTGLVTRETKTGGTVYTPTIESLGNGVYKISTYSDFTAGTYVWIGLAADPTYTDAGQGFQSYAGDGASGLYVAKPQAEIGAFATSHIPAVTSEVTRTVDAGLLSGAMFRDFVNPLEGTLYAEFDSASVISATAVTLGDGTTDNRIQLGINATGQKQGFISTAGVGQVNELAAVAAANARVRLAIGYANNNTNMAADGALVGDDTACTVPSSVSKLYLGTITGGSNILNGHLRRIRYWPRRLSNIELQELTR